MNDLSKYTVLITGAASGNGFGIASYCMNYFMNLILVDKDRNGLLNAKSKLLSQKEINNNFQSLEIIDCDLSNSDEIDELIYKLKSKQKTIQCLVNNAGISLAINEKMTLKNKLDIWDQTLKVNLTAPYHLAIGLEKLIPDKVGTIINITSLNSTLAFPNNPAYMSSKGGLRQLSMSLAIDLSHREIRVNSIAPGYFKTNMTKLSWEDKSKRNERSSKTLLKRWGMPNELGGTVCFLASSISSYITGQEIYVDGGWSAKGL